MAKSPLALVKEKFGDKAKLVAAVEKFTSDDLWVSRTNKDKGLAHVSNAKLLRLHAVFSQVKEKFGSRAKLIDAILEAQKRTKDDGYRTRLEAHPVPRLFDEYRVATRRDAKAAAPAVKKATKAEKAEAVAAKKTAKKAAAKKAAASNKPATKGTKKKSTSKTAKR